jgi:hypothetical protein
MSIGETVVQTIANLIELAVHVVVRSFGLSEEKVEKLEFIVGWSLAFIFVAGLFYLTIKYS